MGMSSWKDMIKGVAGDVLTEKQIRLINACPSLKNGILLTSFLADKI